MSTDQKNLYHTSRAIIDGNCPTSLAIGSIGPVCHARWLTLAVRLNFLYMSDENPSDEVKRLASFVVRIYGLLWFFAKQNWKAFQGPQVVFKAMKLFISLPLAERRIVCPVFERGFLYWAHPEQLFLACLASPDPDIRSRAIARIIKIRSGQAVPPKPVVGKKRGRKSVKTVRELELPDPVYHAADFSTMIDWESSQITEPPLLRDLSSEEILAFQAVPFTCAEPSNTQFVERHIQMITKKGTKAASPTLRNGLNHATAASQARRSSRETSKHYFSK